MARLAYLGTPDIAVPPLHALVAAGHEVTLCVTRPDRRRGRGGATSASPVKEAALALDIPVSHSMEDIASPEANVDLGVVVAYGRIIPVALLERVPMVNLHFSLLPRWRGAAPVERAILAGDALTGVCVMKVEEGLDTGPIYARRTLAVRDDIDLSSLRSQLVDLGAGLLVEVLANGVENLPIPESQQGDPTTAEKLTPGDLELDWNLAALQLHRVVRLGRAWTTFRGRRLGVLSATEAAPDPAPTGPPGTLMGTTVATGTGTILLQRVQPEGRSPMTASEWLRGVRPAEGERLGSG